MEVSRKQILDVVKQKYSFTPKKINKLRDIPSRSTYLLKSANRSIILKAYHREHKETEVNEAIEIQRYLMTVAYPLPEIITSNDEEYVVTDKEILWVCYAVVPGVARRLTDDSVIIAAKLLKQLHHVAFSGGAIVHGDFLLNNILISQGMKAYVIDWDFAHSGNPEEDLKWFVECEIVRSSKPEDEKLRLNELFMKTYA